MSVLSWNRYGKSRIRLVKVRRAPARAGQTDAPHEVVDLTIDVQLEGAFEVATLASDGGRLRSVLGRVHCVAENSK